MTNHISGTAELQQALPLKYDLQSGLNYFPLQSKYVHNL